MRSSAVLVFLGLLALPACGGDGGGGPGGGGEGDDAPQSVSDPRVLVEVAQAETGSVADYLLTTGNLESEAQADITPETTGTVTKILVEEGDQVRAGQLLAVIDNPSLDASLTRTELENASAQRALAETRNLHAQGAISNRELREAEKLAQTAEITFSEARESQDFRRITSPISGTVSARNVRLGEMASAGVPAFQVVDLDTLRVVVNLPEKDLPRVRTGQSVVLSGAYETENTAKGSIQRISPVVDVVSGTVRVVVAVDPDQSVLRPGQFVKVRVEVDRHDDVRTIPQEALVYVDGEPVAWKLVDKLLEEEEAEDAAADGEDEAAEEDGGIGAMIAGIFGGEGEGEAGEEEEEFDPWEGVPRRGVEKVRLEVGFTDPERAEVIDGLELGDEVVTIGNSNLREDTLVRLVDDPDLKQPPGDEEGEAAAKGDEEDKSGEG